MDYIHFNPVKHGLAPHFGPRVDDRTSGNGVSE
jgi:hypothetical protein